MGPTDSVAFDMQGSTAATTSASVGLSGASPAAFDVAHFDAAYAAAGQAIEPTTAVEQTPATAATDPAGYRMVLSSLGDLNDGAQSIAAAADSIGSNPEVKPSELLMLTIKAQEFMFHCEVTANVANRTSDGVQQLFQQQS